MTTTAREIMTPGAECASTNDTVSDAARKMKDLGVGALPICSDDNRLAGMITDRDIVLNCVAEGMDSNQVKVSDYAGGRGRHDRRRRLDRRGPGHHDKAGVRRLPVIDGHDLVGMVSQADIARNLPDDKVGDLVQAISSTAGQQLTAIIPRPWTID